MRKFNHKQTGWIAKEVKHLPTDHLMLYDNGGNEQGAIYKKIVTEGNDWIELLQFNDTKIYHSEPSEGWNHSKKEP